MSKVVLAGQALNIFLMTVLAVAVVGFVSFGNIYGMFLALISAFIAVGVYKRNRWAYFSAAAWGLACYQLAKQGYEFQSIKRYVMIVGIALIPIALFLHEVMAKKPEKNPQHPSDQDKNKNSMPD